VLAIVDAGVKAQFVHRVFAFVRAAGNAHHAAAARLGQGAKGTAHRALAALTTTVSPALGAMILTRPYQAVTPGMPTAPR
jgi:hypothetical protein